VWKKKLTWKEDWVQVWKTVKKEAWETKWKKVSVPIWKEVKVWQWDSLFQPKIL